MLRCCARSAWWRRIIAWGNVAHQTNIVANLDGTATTNVIWAADDIFVSAGKSAILSHCCAADVAGLASEQVVVVNSLAADPLFNLGKKANLPYWGILGNSPCKNAGKKLEWMTEGTTDLVGNPRVFGGKPDLGCYESLSGGLMLIVR